MASLIIAFAAYLFFLKRDEQKKDDLEEQLNSVVRDVYDARIWQAVRDDNIALAQQLLEEGVGVRQFRDKGIGKREDLPLIHEASSGQMIKLLVEYGAPLHLKDSSGNDVLGHLLMLNDDLSYEKILEIISISISLGAPLLYYDNLGYSRLDQAVTSCEINTTKALLAVGHPIKLNHSKYTPLHKLCWNSRGYESEEGTCTENIIRALVAAGISVNEKDESGRTPLHWAVAGDGPDKVAIKTLLSLGADPNSLDENGMTPLSFMYETMFGYEIAVPLLLKAGANPLISLWRESAKDVS